MLLPRGGAPFDERYGYLFNSYYNAVGEQYPRERRGLMSRPTVDEIWRYRDAIDERVERLLEAGLDDVERGILEVGLNHEQQHQELMLTDIKHVLAQSPTSPRYGGAQVEADGGAAPMDFVELSGGLLEIGHDGASFCYDNELPRHSVFLQPYALASRLVTVDEYRAFIADDGYRRPELWLSEGWDWCQRESIQAPLYWREAERVFTLNGERAHRGTEPVTHVSLYEADAYARWAGFRLPREAELEHAAATLCVDGNFAESGALHPSPAQPRPAPGNGIQQLFGDAWEWTQSAYAAYPGYRAADGALGEYNGKFMCNQHVLRGGSCVTSRDQMRASYRNFFPASTRWQFTSIRLAADR